MKRRTFIAGSAALMATQAQAQDDASKYAALLAELTPEEALATRASRELGSRLLVVTESQGQRRRARSKLPVSQRAIDLIVEFEVSSKEYYIASMEPPIWPGGNSGVTIGIGYDLGFVSPDLFAKDWKGILPDEGIKLLAPASHLTGTKARDAISKFSAARVTWQQANLQFVDFLPYIVAETNEAFPNLDKLTPDARGALVSLVYNRGGSTIDTPRRREMYQIRQLMIAGDFLDDKIPKLIEDMKRLWVGERLPGLLKRRDLEAVLFRLGTPK